MFAKKKTRVIHLLRARDNVNVPQIIIDRVKELRFTFLDVTCNFLPGRYGVNCYFIAPNKNWQHFIEDEYKINDNIDLYDYLNSNESCVGDYLKLWLEKFRVPKNYNYIRNDNIDLLFDNIETCFSNNVDNFVTTRKNILNKVNSSLKKIKSENLYQILKDKLFVFSHKNGRHKKLIFLKENLSVQVIDGKESNNEIYWGVQDGKFVFRNSDYVVTSIFKKSKKIIGRLEFEGKFIKNKDIEFKLYRKYVI